MLRTAKHDLELLTLLPPPPSTKFMGVHQLEHSACLLSPKFIKYTDRALIVNYGLKMTMTYNVGSSVLANVALYICSGNC